MNLGSTYYYLNQPAEALNHYQQAGCIFNQLHDKLNSAKIATGLGLSYLALQEYMEAARVFLSSIQLFAELEDDSLRLNATDGLVMTYIADQQYEEAIALAEQALNELTRMTSAPNYPYLLQSLTIHLAEARRGQTSRISE